MSPKPTSDAKRHIRSFGRRKTKGLRATRAGAMEDVLPHVQIEFPKGEGIIDPHSFFDTKVKEVWLEIGFGNGEHILHQALNNPDIGLIGCEPFMNGVAALCVGIGEKKVNNIRIWPEDARLLMERLKPKSLDRLFLLHPDPWPKNRHHKRRFVQTETLDQIAGLLKPNAEFRMATDHPELATWLLEKTYFHPAFAWSATSSADWRTPPADWPETRYGQKGVKQGRPPVYFSFCRKVSGLIR
jgi:tRNA (guanine-N7-)-methyltransferase